MNIPIYRWGVCCRRSGMAAARMICFLQWSSGGKMGREHKGVVCEWQC